MPSYLAYPISMWSRPGLYRLRHLHRALKRAGLTGIGRTDDQGSFVGTVG